MVKIFSEQLKDFNGIIPGRQIPGQGLQSHIPLNNKRPSETIPFSLSSKITKDLFSWDDFDFALFECIDSAFNLVCP